MDELEIIEQCRSGKKSAYNELFQLYGNQALRTAFLITGSTAIAEDVVQEAFIQCFKSIHTLRNPKAFQSWFYQMVVRISWRVGKKEKKHAHLDTDDITIEPKLASDSFWEDLERRQACRAVQDAILQLDQISRTTVILYYFNELSVKEISGVLHCFEGTVKSRLHTARKKLEKLLVSKNVENPVLETKYEKECHVNG